MVGWTNSSKYWSIYHDGHWLGYTSGLYSGPALTCRRSRVPFARNQNPLLEIAYRALTVKNTKLY